jgi:predicted nucleic acid-binding protein
VSRVFVDTSAAFALLVASDLNHGRASDAFRRLGERMTPLVTTSYVLVETYALLGRRVGLEAVKAFRDDLEPVLDVSWVGRELHERGLDLLGERRLVGLSLVDAVSFLLMREEGIDEAFAYDRHFEREGFAIIA